MDDATAEGQPRRPARPRPSARTVSVWSGAALLLLALAACLDPAISGRSDWDAGSLIVPVLAVGGGQWLRNADHRALTTRDRERVRDATRSGVPTGSPPVDAVARERLERAAASRSRASRGLRAVLLVVVAALPVIAAIRTDQAWYLLALVGTVGPQPILWRRPAGEDPAARLARFDAAARDAST